MKSRPCYSVVRGAGAFPLLGNCTSLPRAQHKLSSNSWGLFWSPCRTSAILGQACAHSQLENKTKNEAQNTPRSSCSKR